MQTQPSALNLPAKLNYDRRKRCWDSIARCFSRLSPGLVRVLCKWYAALRSFRGHIRIQSAKGGARVDLGPSVQFHGGRYQANLRTLARAEGIEKLRAIHQWVDIADLRIFLMGFEAGEEYSNTDRLRRDSSDARNIHA